MPKPDPYAERWTEAPIVFVESPPRPPCPWCGTTVPPMSRRGASDQGDGSRLRKCTCRCCSRRFKIVVEIVAKSGKTVFWPAHNDE